MKIVTFLGSISYYSATQFSNPLKSPTSVEFEERENYPSYRPSSRRDPHTKFIHDLIKLRRENLDKYDRFLNMIGGNGIELVDDISFEEIQFTSEEVNVKSGGKIVKENRRKEIVVPKISIGKNTLSFNQLSEGTLKTIALLFYVIENDNNLLLIEEPEVCVHHGLLNSVIEVIKNESEYKQIIISTHSDFVIDKLTPEDLIIVSRDRESGTAAKRLSKALSKNSYKALHEYLETSGNLGDYWKESGFAN